MAEWRYIATRLNGDGTETDLAADLPLEGVSITEAVSGPNALSASIPMPVARLKGLDGRPVFEEWSTALYAEADGVIRAGAILTDLSISSGSQLSLSCGGFTTAIDGQPYEGGKFFIQTDALDIGRHVWDHWQAREGGNLGLILDRETMTGTKLGTELKQVEFDSQAGPVSFEAGPVKLNDYSTDDLGGFFKQLSSAQGFDYLETHRWNDAGTAIEHHLDFGAPRIGTRRADLRFVVGENVFAPPAENLGEDYYSGVLVRGAGDGPAMKRTLTLRGGEKRLRRIRIITDSTLRTDTAVKQRALDALPKLIGSTDVTELEIVDSGMAPVGSWSQGDEILLQTDSDWGDSALWVRVLSTTFSPANLSVAKVTVTRADKLLA